MSASDKAKLFIGVMLFLAWVLLVVFHVTGAEDIIKAIQLALLGLGAYHLNDRTNLPPPPPATAPTVITVNSSQAGFARPLLLLMLAAVSILMAGCASWIQAADAYNTSGITSARAAEDLNVKIWKENACGTPLSTIVRHPEIAGGLKALCLSESGGTATDLLGAIPAASTTTTTPAATPTPAK